MLPLPRPELLLSVILNLKFCSHIVLSSEDLCSLHRSAQFHHIDTCVCVCVCPQAAFNLVLLSEVQSTSRRRESLQRSSKLSSSCPLLRPLRSFTAGSNLFRHDIDMSCSFPDAEPYLEEEGISFSVDYIAFMPVVCFAEFPKSCSLHKNRTKWH